MAAVNRHPRLRRSKRVILLNRRCSTRLVHAAAAAAEKKRAKTQETEQATRVIKKGKVLSKSEPNKETPKTEQTKKEPPATEPAEGTVKSSKPTSSTENKTNSSKRGATATKNKQKRKHEGPAKPPTDYQMICRAAGVTIGADEQTSGSEESIVFTPTERSPKQANATRPAVRRQTMIDYTSSKDRATRPAVRRQTMIDYTSSKDRAGTEYGSLSSSDDDEEEELAEYLRKQKAELKKANNAKIRAEVKSLKAQTHLARVQQQLLEKEAEKFQERATEIQSRLLQPPNGESAGAEKWNTY